MCCEPRSVHPRKLMRRRCSGPFFATTVPSGKARASRGAVGVTVERGLLQYSKFLSVPCCQHAQNATKLNTTAAQASHANYKCNRASSDLQVETPPPPHRVPQLLLAVLLDVVVFEAEACEHGILAQRISKPKYPPPSQRSRRVRGRTHDVDTQCGELTSRMPRVQYRSSAAECSG